MHMTTLHRVKVQGMTIPRTVEMRASNNQFNGHLQSVSIVQY